MDVFSMFRNPQPPQQQPPNNQQQPNQNPNLPPNQQQQPQNNDPQNRAALNPDPNNPNPANLTDPNAKKSPLADFADLWKNDAPKEGEEAPTDWANPDSILPNIKVDPKKLYEMAQRIDFSKVMNPEKVKLALSGDQAAFGEVINSAVQHAYANMAMSSTRITEAMIKQMGPKIFGALPFHIRKHVVSDTVRADNPIFNNPAAAPLLEGLEAQMRVKYPTASAKEISEKAKKYVEDFAAAARGESQPGQRQQGQPGVRQRGKVQEQDFSDFLEIPNQQ